MTRKSRDLNVSSSFGHFSVNDTLWFAVNDLTLGTGHYLSRGGGAGANKGWVTIFYAEV